MLCETRSTVRSLFYVSIAVKGWYSFTIIGGGKYIHIEGANPDTVNQSAQLLSPLIRGPRCLRFYYYMYGRDLGNLDVSLQLQGQPGAYLMWRKSGEQSDQWMRASVDIGYNGKYQVRRKEKTVN